MGALFLLAMVAILSIPAWAAGLIIVGPNTPAANGGYLINTYNTAAVQNGLAANQGSVFTLLPGQLYTISQVATYHFNGGKGAPAGQITIATAQSVPIRTVNASVVGVFNWVATLNPPLTLPSGTYILLDSSPQTWSNNAGSSGCLAGNPRFQCGFVRMIGIVTAVPPAVAVPPPPAPRAVPFSGDGIGDVNASSRTTK